MPRALGQKDTPPIVRQRHINRLFSAIALIAACGIFKIPLSYSVNSAAYIPAATFGEGEEGTGAVPSFPRRRLDVASIDATVALASLGPNVLTVHSGCRIARWVYPFAPDPNPAHNHWKLDDCHAAEPEKVLHHLSQLRENDTLYVTHARLGHFAEQLRAEGLGADVVVLSGQWSKVAPARREDADYVAGHPRVVRWFVQNADVYGNGTGPGRGRGVEPFPYGVQERPHMKQKPAQLWLTQYRDAFLEALRRDARGHNASATAPRIYAGYLRSLGTRAGMDVEVTAKLDRSGFYAALSRHDYVLSPDGDRPECYRHYEALGLGTAPLTQLDRRVHRHLVGTGTVFGNTVWSVKELEATLPAGPAVVRNAALEEYWMEYVDWVVRRRLTWYDAARGAPTTVDRLLANLTF